MTLAPPALDLSETIAASPDPRAMAMVDQYARLIAWHDFKHDVYSEVANNEGNRVHAAMKQFVDQWPLAKPHLMLRYLHTYQAAKRILRSVPCLH